MSGKGVDCGTSAARKLRVLFVGAFSRSAADGAVGGQIYACTSLVASEVSDEVDWLLLDSTMRSLPPPGLPRRLVSGVVRLVRFLGGLSKRPDAVLIFSSAGMSFVEKGGMCLIAACLGRPVIFCARSGLILSDLERSRFMRWYLPVVFRHSAAVVCQSRSWKDTYQKISALGDGKFEVVPNWIDAEPYVSLSRGRAGSGDAVRFLFLGWIERNKGIFELIEAFGDLSAKRPDAKLIVCGRGGAFEEVRRKVVELGLSGKVELRGWVTGEEKLSLLKSCDAFVLPSFLEGMPNALLEAMASGLPVIASRVGGIPETLDNGRFGLLVDPGDVGGVTRAMLMLAESSELRGRLGRLGQTRVLDIHGRSQASGRILSLLKRVCWRASATLPS